MPVHLMPPYKDYRCRYENYYRNFRTGINLPNSVGLTNTEIEKV